MIPTTTACCGLSSRTPLRHLTQGRLLALVLCASLLAILQPRSAAAQQWEPAAPEKAKLETLRQSFDKWLADHRPALYYEIIEGRDPRSVLLKNPEVMLAYIGDDGEPVWYESTNLISAQTISTDEVWPGGSSVYSLNGAGTTGAQLGIWEAGGAVRTTHQELTGRVTQIDAVATTNHATHVAGTMIGGGVSANAQGMSFQASLNAWDANNDTAEMTTAAGNGMLISNHSYGTICGWNPNDGNWYGTVATNQNEDWKFGFYNATAQQWDQLAVTAGNYLIFKSAGNDRNDFAPAPGTAHLHGSAGASFTDNHNSDGAGGGFDTIPTSGCAKNIMTVGAVNDIAGGYTAVGNVVQSAFSGWGPTDDGRIKPDIVANGVGLFSSGNASDTAYATMDGTSMSTPSASGSANLLRGQFQALNGAPPRSATLKAIIINSADEAGPANGPDYMNGWGLMNTLSAADIIAAGEFDDRGIIEDAIANGGSDTHTLYVNTTGPVRVTIVWTDPAGTPPGQSLDPANVMLVNDLDLRVQHMPSSTTTMPWVLNPASPANAATQGDNTRDNVEQVDLANAPEGQYQVVVSHKGTLSGSPQQYSLVYSGMSVNAAPIAVCQDVTKSADENCVAIVTAAEVDNGSSDPDGDPITFSLSPAGPYALGTTNVTLTVTDDKGASDTCTATITVEDTTPPVIVCPLPITVECSAPGGTPKDDPQLAGFFASVSATDNCDDTPTITDDAPALFAGPCDASNGITTVTFTATDDAGNSASCSVDVQVIDTTAPTISVVLNRDTLWPPNHKLATITVTELTVADICDPDPTWVLTSITSDEPDNNGGDGNTTGDIVDADYGTPDTEFRLRAERSGGEDGRTYSIVYTVTDCSGNSSSTEVHVQVPHDQSGHALAATGFSADGGALDLSQKGFHVVVPSSSQLDATKLDPDRVLVGSFFGVIHPLSVQVRDVNGDGAADLEALFSTREYQELEELANAKSGEFLYDVTDPLTGSGEIELQKELLAAARTIGLHTWGLDASPWLVEDIFALGRPIELPAVEDKPQPDPEKPQIANLPVGSNDAQSGSLTKQGESAASTGAFFSLSKPGYVRVDVFNVAGRRLSTLISAQLPAGRHELSWDGRDATGSTVARGVYLYRIESPDGIEIRKTVVLD